MNQSSRGSISIILAAASYGLYGIYSRYIGESFGEFSQSWTRNSIILLILGIYLIFSRSWKRIDSKHKKWMILWPLSDVFSIILLYITFNNLSIGTSYFLLYSTMITSGYLFGKLFYKERIDLVKCISLIFCFIGLGLIFSVELSPNKAMYIIFGMISGISTGLWNTLSKKVSDFYSNTQLVFIDSLVALCATLIGSLIAKDNIPSLSNPIWFWQIAYAITQISAVSFVIFGFKYLEAAVASIILPVEVLFATFFGYIFFHEILSFNTFLGGLLIASAAVLPNVALYYNQRKHHD